MAKSEESRRETGRKVDGGYPDDVAVAVTVHISRAIHAPSVTEEDTFVTGAPGDILESFLHMSLDAMSGHNDYRKEDGRVGGKPEDALLHGVLSLWIVEIIKGNAIDKEHCRCLRDHIYTVIIPFQIALNDLKSSCFARTGAPLMKKSNRPKDEESKCEEGNVCMNV
jgi:hypothetical protein